MSSEALDCELGLRAAVMKATDSGSPPKLADAIEYAVFPGGARVRPKLTQAVALAHGNPEPGISMAASVAIELLHCASLVHDDLPCFDDATLRRGKPSVHSVFGERIAVLTGDALIVAAFDRLFAATLDCQQPQWAARAAQWVSRGVGSPHGICAGQAWECEPRVDLEQYHKAKTGALFIAATCAGAAAAGADPAEWEPLGAAIGQAYQVADDIQDAIADTETAGKNVGIDVSLERPSAVRELGLDGAITRLNQCVEHSLEVIPNCPGRDVLLEVVQFASARFFPKGLRKTAA